MWDASCWKEARLLIDEDGFLVCPFCDTPWSIEQGDVPTAFPDRDKYDSPIGTRGGWMFTEPWCSACESSYRLVIGNHKGALRLALLVRVLTEVALDA